MDHARHLSSPNPGSDVNSVEDDCFSMASSTNATTTSQQDQSSNNNHNDNDNNNNLQNGIHQGDQHHHHNPSFDGGDDNRDDGESHILVSDDDIHEHHNHHAHHDHELEEVNPTSESDHHLHDHSHHVQHIHQNHDQQHHVQHIHQDHLVGDQDSLNGVDAHEDDGMHNMLSGSSTSSTATMPLLSDAHSDHPFSRISIEEYSPLSLVDDCDNALTISPTSLACGSHHSFKSSLNNLKLDNLDGVDGVGVHVVDHVDDVVGGGDARSMSPSMMSATTSALQNHLWSNSSTAITQNPALLTSSSTSFLLAHHHHHHQLNSLMQQLEPPSLINHGALFESDQLEHHHRPSSEPPPGCSGSESMIDANNNTKSETKSISSDQSASSSITQAKSKATAARGKSKSSQASPPASSNRSSRKSRSKVSAPNSNNNSTTTINNINNSSTSKTPAKPKSSSNPSKAIASKKPDPKEGSPQSEPSYCSSKVHLQLNHHQKLKELQQRLFGSTTAKAASASSNAQANTNSNSAKSAAKIEYGSDDPGDDVKLKTQPSTGGTHKVNSNDTAIKQAQSIKSQSSNLAPVTEQAGTQTTTVTKSRPRFRQTPRRRHKPAAKTGSSVSASSLTMTTSNQKIVATESVEPDTTTKSSDCIKLADLLTSSNNVEANGKPSTGSGSTDNGGPQLNTNDPCKQEANSSKRIQQIQLQVSPSSLKLMTNGGSLVQSLGVQQQQQLAVVGSDCASFDNQVLCRPVTVMTSLSSNTNSGNSNSNIAALGDQQLKCNIVPSGEWLKTADAAMLTNWSTVNQNSSNSGSNQSNVGPTSISNQGIGTHQIAIQVICQDGTSLVLPVSSAASLNAAVSMAPQGNQQLQAALTNVPVKSSNPQQQQQHQVQKFVNQNIPLVSVANILAQQQTTTSSMVNSEAGVSQTAPPIQSGNNQTATQASGLAASSPTLAALLDAGTNRIANIGTNDTANSNHSIVPSSLLRKLIGVNAGGNSIDLKSGEISLQQGTPFGLTNNGSLVTICTTSASSSALINSNVRLNPAGTHCSIGDKRIKLDNVTEVDGNIQTTFTLIEPQGLIVASGNEAGGLLQGAQQSKQADLQQAKVGAQGSVPMSNGPMSTLQQQLNMTTTPKVNSDISGTGANKHSKMTSSTGNRQVDPTQPFRCEHCNSTFTRLGNFTRHKKIHSAPTKDGQRFKCDVCSKSFLQRCDLARHLHIHRGTEPHRCNICGKGYIRHSDLVTHQRFHNKEKPFGCPHCSKGFCQRGDLNRHLRSIHLQMKPILCPCCNRKFAKQETLLRHLNTSHRS